MTRLNLAVSRSVFVAALVCSASQSLGFAADGSACSPNLGNMLRTGNKNDSIPGNSYELTRLAPGVYAAVRRVEAGTADGNTMFIINDTDVIVVDTGAYPASARQMIGEIRKLTDRPVRYIVNTHWHGDHTLGNQAYLAAFPGVEIIAHPANRELAMPLEKMAAAFRDEIANVDRELASGKTSDGEALTPTHRKHIELAKSDFEFWIEEENGALLSPATLTVADSLVLHRGERTIEVRYLGAGHTRGDLVVYLPKERIVATGDLIVHPVPFGGATNLKEWSTTLWALKKLDAATIVPGHGEIQRDWTYVDRQIALLESTWEQVKKAVDAGADLEGARKAVNGDALSTAFGAISPKDREEFVYTYLDSAVEAAFKELRPETATKK